MIKASKNKGGRITGNLGLNVNRERERKKRARGFVNSSSWYLFNVFKIALFSVILLVRI